MSLTHDDGGAVSRPRRLRLVSAFVAATIVVVLSLVFASDEAEAQACREPFVTVFVDAVNGSDATGDGSAATPWKSLSHGIDQIGPTFDQTRVQLAPGVYDASNGESFPMSVPPFVGIRGATTAPSILNTGGADGLQMMAFEQAGCGPVQNLVITSGVATPSGRGITVDYCIDDCLRHNVISGFARGISLDYVFWSWFGGGFQVTRIDGNHLSDNGVGIYHRLSSSPAIYLYDLSEIVNNVLVDNQRGIELAYWGDPADLIVASIVGHNTIVGSTDDGIRISEGTGMGPVSLTSNILAANGGYGIDATASPALLLNNDFWMNATGDYVGAASSVDNIALDPLFVAPAIDDFRLLPSSPCVDTGLDGGSDHDYEEAVRPQDGDGDFVAVPDIGAYELPAVVVTADLRRADFSALDPVQPAIAAAFPFDATNPLTPVVLSGFVSGDVDPTFGILTEPSTPLALYQIDPPGGYVIVLVKDNPNLTVEVHMR